MATLSRKLSYTLLHPRGIHAFEAVFFEVLAHEPADVFIGRGQPLFHEGFALLRQGDYGYAPAVSQPFAKGDEIISFAVGDGRNAGGDGIEDVEDAGEINWIFEQTRFTEGGGNGSLFVGCADNPRLDEI